MAFNRIEGQIAAHESWAKTPDRSARTRNARLAMENKFYDQVDPDRVLPQHVREKMAESARKAHFRRLALASARARGILSPYVM